eukprot:TRINITY_DN21845_c0_g1_i11.p2 TRINITY_DN21845_c0_g1~~TRINITY_DN21845_c0_g1_i11.p2  ORF type:complete len:270 (-),score=7.98 TRINITY_DN21845_c0_g1_i11:325-1134(-)
MQPSGKNLRTQTTTSRVLLQAGDKSKTIFSNLKKKIVPLVFCFNNKSSLLFLLKSQIVQSARVEIVFRNPIYQMRCLHLKKQVQARIRARYDFQREIEALKSNRASSQKLAEYQQQCRTAADIFEQNAKQCLPETEELQKKISQRVFTANNTTRRNKVELCTGGRGVAQRDTNTRLSPKRLRRKPIPEVVQSPYFQQSIKMHHYVLKSPVFLFQQNMLRTPYTRVYKAKIRGGLQKIKSVVEPQKNGKLKAQNISLQSENKIKFKQKFI